MTYFLVGCVLFAAIGFSYAIMRVYSRAQEDIHDLRKEEFERLGRTQRQYTHDMRSIIAQSAEQTAKQNLELVNGIQELAKKIQAPDENYRRALEAMYDRTTFSSGVVDEVTKADDDWLDSDESVISLDDPDLIDEGE